MVRRRKIPLAAVLLLTGLSLCACSGTGTTFDPLDWISADWLNPKTPLPGKREPVFPEGVPGVPQGVPKELVKGYQQQQTDVATTEPAPEAAPKPQPRRPAPKPRTASVRPAASATTAAAPPKPQKPTSPPTAQWPDGAAVQPPSNAPSSSSAPAAKGVPQADWPGPDTTTFSH